MEGFQKSQNGTMTEIRKTQEEFLNSFCDTEGDVVGDENNTAVSPTCMSLENSEQIIILTAVVQAFLVPVVYNTCVHITWILVVCPADHSLNS